MKKFLTVLLLASCTLLSAFAQKVEVSGTVVSASDGLPLPGAGVVVEGTTVGTSTDLDGYFVLSVDPDAVLSFSFFGYVTQNILVSDISSPINVVLEEDVQMIEETVIVGYGVQKKSVVTASIAKISADDLTNTSPVRVDNALKGLAAGVSVTSSSGQPGASSRIRVRGVGTINNSDPLYIVDGMPIEGGIDYLNPSDIQSIEVLKDAASGAVYGARAANGVILVTTKVGTKGTRARLTYDFSMGWQSPWRTRDVLNATEYAIMMNEGAVNSGQAIKYADPYSYGEGTDWQKEVFNYNAPVESHNVSLSGSSGDLSYLLSLGYYNAEGIVGGNYGRSNYDRLTLRSNTQYKVFDASEDRTWLNKLTANINLSYANINSTGVATNSQWGSPLGSALALSPILTVYDEGDAAQAQLDKYASTTGYYPIYSSDGKLYSVPGPDYNEMVNPLASLSLPGDQNWSNKFVANASADLTIWDNLVFRTSLGMDMSFYGYDGYTTLFYLSGNNKSDKTQAYSQKSDSKVWQIENTLSYNKTIGEHSFSVLLGQSAKKSSGSYLYGVRYDINNLDRPYIDASSGLQDEGRMATSGAPFDEATLASLFARVSYDYAERYMFQATVRRDGSSRFGSNNHYAIFPSFSLGWNLTNEDFMMDRPSWLERVKFRASWGKNGNENIGNFQYTVLTSSSNNYYFGNPGTMYIGVKSSGLANPDLKWEESTQIDLGVDFGFFENALTFTVDYYRKDTDGMLMTMNIPSYVGENKPIGNVGSMRNSGVEFELAYKLVRGDWTMGINANASYLKNVLLEYGNETGWANLDSFQTVGTISRAQNGMPFPYFYGYKTDGIFQNVSEVNAYVNSDGELLQPNAVPGDVRFVDVNGDGAITDDDRTYIGKGMPDWTYGLNLNLGWKNFDFSMMLQGTLGNQIYDATRRVDISSSNLPSYMLGRWTGEGTSNHYPRFVLGDNANWVSSDLYVYDGSYMRVKNVQFGYTLPENLTKKAFVSRLRIYVAAENLLTLTKYHGYDPEISDGGTSLGVDYGIYPQARTFSLGLNLVF